MLTVTIVIFKAVHIACRGHKEVVLVVVIVSSVLVPDTVLYSLLIYHFPLGENVVTKSD